MFTLDSTSAVSNSLKLDVPQKINRLLNFRKNARAANCIADSVYTDLLHKISFWYAKEGYYLTAISYTQEAVKTVEDNRQKTSINPADLIKSYYWLSVFYESLNNNYEKIRMADSCLSLAQRLKLPDDSYRVRCLNIRVEYDFDIGDYQRCVKDAELCEQLAWRYVAKNTAYAEFGKDVALTSSGWMVEALIQLKDYKTAEAVLSNKINAYKTEKESDYVGFLYSELAEIEVQKADYAKALLLLNRALRIDKKGGFNYTCKQILNTIGHDVFFDGYKQPQQALFYYNKALRYRNKESNKNVDDAMETMEILGRIADVYVQQNKFDSAFVFYQRAFNLLKPKVNGRDGLQFSPEQLEDFKKTHILAALLLSKADAFLRRYKSGRNDFDGREAIRLYRNAERLLVLLRSMQTDMGSKLFWRSNTHHLYEKAIEAAYLSGDVENAFYFFEKSRAVLLHEQVMQQRFLSTEEIERHVQLQKTILLEEKELAATNPSSKNYEALHQALFTDQQILHELEQSIREKNPLYYQSVVLDTSVIRLEDVRRNILADHQAILQLFSGDSAVYALLITANKTFLNKIDKPLFDTLSKQYTAYLANFSLLNKNFEGYKSVAHQLYSLLFRDAPPNGRIIISPDGRNFPFESLVVSNGKSPVYFLADHAVSYTYSLRYLYYNFPSNIDKKQGDFMGVAPVNFGGSLASLPGSDASLMRLSRYFNDGYNLTFKQASRSNFLRNFSHYNIIQLYSHASGSGGEPVLYFADSALALSDLFLESKPATRLIVLSACETGEGQMYLGEGVFSFNRSFAACGIPSSVVNLWSVDNNATYKLTELFYRYISKGLPVDLALQSAKKEFLQTASRREGLPYYWAAAVLVGKTDAVVQPLQSSSFYLLLYGLLCLAAATVAYFSVLRLRLVFI